MTTDPINWIEVDHLNSPKSVVKLGKTKDGYSYYHNIVWRWETEPYGSYPAQETIKFDYGYGPNNIATTTTFTMNLRFSGQIYDKETGTHYNVFRDYDPQTGRYLQADPIGLGGGMNRWGYVGGNPMGGVDPLGLRANGGTPPWYLQPVPIFDPCSKLNQLPSDLGKMPKVRESEKNKLNPFSPGSFGYGGGVMAGLIGGGFGVDFQPTTFNEICVTGKFCGHVGMGLYAGAGLNAGIGTSKPSPTDGLPDLSVDLGGDYALLWNGGGNINIGLNPISDPGVAGVGASTALPWFNYGIGGRVYTGLCWGYTVCYSSN